MTGLVRTRFAPSPTGYLHIGGARTALFSWAYAKRFGGTFVLRIEDTDLERSTPEATQAILDGMRWLDLKADEGPFFQMQRMDRYCEIIAQMLVAGTAYHCYASKEELDQMRQAQEAAGVKTRYDGRWRPEAGKTLPAPPPDAAPVVRFCNPPTGAVTWEDLVKGQISIANEEMDDLIIARSDGTPTYNFCVVVDDIDMKITHVIRGDDHVNNTPRQINIMRALGALPPRYGHVPLLHGMDGQKLSKRHGAVSVMQYGSDGYLPEAVCNYLSRLGWSHGDDELFSREQFVSWFDAEHISKGPARFDFEKLKWVNNQYMQRMSGAELVARVSAFLPEQNSAALAIDIAAASEVLKERCSTLLELRDWLGRVCVAPTIDSTLKNSHLAGDVPSHLVALANALQQTDWNKEAIATTIKTVLTQLGLKMPQLAMPARVALFGTAQTPALDLMLTLLPKKEAVARLSHQSLAT
jgi:glutamyl-tRNA synthetase